MRMQEKLLLLLELLDEVLEPRSKPREERTDSSARLGAQHEDGVTQVKRLSGFGGTRRRRFQAFKPRQGMLRAAPHLSAPLRNQAARIMRQITVCELC